MIAGKSSLTKLPIGRGLGPAKASSPAQFPIRIAEIQGRMPNQSLANSTHDRHASRYGYVLGQTLSSIVLSFDAWFFSTTGETNNGNDFSIVTCSIEAPNGTVVPVTFSGSRTRTLTNGDTHITSDEIPASAFGQALTRGGTYWVKTLTSVSSGGKVPSTDAISVSDVTGSQAVWYTAANTTPSSTDVAGVYTATGTAFTSSTYGIRPIMLGRPVANNDSYIAIGDSIGQSFYDSGNGIGGNGCIQRFAYNYGTNPVPMLNFCRASARTPYFNSGTKWRPYLANANRCLEQLGHNDVFNYTFGQIQTNTTTLAGIISGGGISRIHKLQLLCKTSSTDNWTTQANQTVTTPFGAGELAEQYDQWCATQVGTLFTSQILTPTIRDPASPYKARTDGSTSQYVMNDGTHPSPYGHACIAADIWFALNPSFAIPDVGGPRVIYDGADATTIFDSAGVPATSGSFNGKVATWNDKSGNARHQTQSTDANRPDYSVSYQINGITVPSYDGTADSMVAPSAILQYGATTTIGAYIPHTTVQGACHIMSNMGTGGGSNRLNLANQCCDFGNTTLNRASPVQDALIVEATRVNGTGGTRQYLKINTDTEITGTVTRNTPDTNYRTGAYANGTTGYTDMELGFVGYWGRKLTPREVNEICSKLATQFGGSWSNAIY